MIETVRWLAGPPLLPRALCVWAECWTIHADHGQWYCAKCMAADSTLEVALKPGARKSSRPKSAINYSNFHKGAPADQSSAADRTGLEPDPGSVGRLLAPL